MRLVQLNIHRITDTQRLQLGIYPLDTHQTVVDRCIYIAGSLPRYTYVDDFDVYTVTELNCYTLWEYPAILSVPFESYKTKFSPYFSLELIIPFWANLSQLDNLTLLLVAMRDQYQDQMPLESFDDIIFYATNAEFRGNFIENLFQDIGKFQVEPSMMIEHCRRLEDIPPSPLDHISQKKYVISGQIDSNGGNLEYVFDQLQTSKDFPIIGFNKYYKAYLYNTISSGWSTQPDIIRVLFEFDGIATQLVIERIENEIRFTTDPIPESMSMPDGRARVSQLLKNLSFQFNDTRSSYVYISDYKFNICILSDLLTVDSNFENLFTANDRLDVLIEYGDRMLHFHNQYNDHTEIGFHLTQTSTPTAQFEFRNIITHEDEAMVTYYLARLLTTYKGFENNIRGDYAYYDILFETFENPSYIPSPSIPSYLSPIPIQPQREKINLFDQGFSTKCQPTTRHPVALTLNEKRMVESMDIDFLRHLETRMVQPKNQAKRIPLLTDEEALRNKYKSLEIIRFPKDQDSYFICLDPKYPYPRMFENEKALYGYQPCCYRLSTSNIQDTKNYFEGTTSAVVSVKNAYVLTTDKIITEGVLGEFHEKTRQYTNVITECFRIAFLDSEEKILRYGIRQSPNSFLECVLTGMKLPTNNLINDRLSLLDKIQPSFLSQEMYQFTPHQITEYLRSEEFLNPLYVIRALERVYKCNILLFRRDGQIPEGSIVLPHHINGYFQYKRNLTLPTLLIYMHNGSESDRLDYPHCELLIHVPKNVSTIKKIPPTAFTFQEDNYVTRFCWKIYNDLAYYQSNESTLDILPIDEDDMKAQWIDEYGKTRFVVSKFDEEMIALYTPPYPPLNLPIIEADELKNFFPFVDQMQSIFGKIPAQDSSFITITYQGRLLRLYSKEISPDKYNTIISNNKLARSMSSWSTRLFSQFLQTEGVSELTTETMSRFIDSSFVIDPQRIYSSEISPLFIESDSPSIIENGRIVCTTVGMRNRLVFGMYMMYNHQRDQLWSYTDMKMLPNYYESMYDFKRYPFENLLMIDGTGDAFTRVISSQSTHNLHLYPIDAPHYFLSHPQIENGNIVSVRNYFKWKDASGDALVYIFHSGNDVERYIIDGGDIKGNKIMITKFGGQVLYGRLVRVD